MTDIGIFAWVDLFKAGFSLNCKPSGNSAYGSSDVAINVPVEGSTCHSPALYTCTPDLPCPNESDSEQGIYLSFEGSGESGRKWRGERWEFWSSGCLSRVQATSRWFSVLRRVKPWQQLKPGTAAVEPRTKGLIGYGLLLASVYPHQFFFGTPRVASHDGTPDRVSEMSRPSDTQPSLGGGPSKEA